MLLQTQPGHLSITSLVNGSTHKLQLSEDLEQARHSVLQVSQVFVAASAYLPEGHEFTHEKLSRSFPGWHVAHWVFEPITHVRHPGSQDRQALLTESSENPTGQLARHSFRWRKVPFGQLSH